MNTYMCIYIYIYICIRTAPAANRWWRTPLALPLIIMFFL